MLKTILLCACLLFAAQGIATADISENFDNIALLPGAGWAEVNNSAPLGTTGWFQGNTGVFSSQAGPPESYIAANFNNAVPGGNISNWLITPVVSLSIPEIITFYTRTEPSSGFADRLEVRLCTNGASTDVGASDTSVGDFTNLLLTINPALDPAGYPDAWTQISAAVNAVGAGATGRFALRYYVTDTNNNGDYIGIDSLVVTTPEPASLIGLATVLAALALRRRAR